MRVNTARNESRLGALIASACLATLGCAAVAMGAEAEQAATPPAAVPMPPTSPPQTEAERKAFAPGDKSPAAVVDAFNQMAFIDHHPVEAMKKYLADDFVEHYPDLAQPGPGTDKERVIRFFETRGWKKGEGMQDIIYRVIADEQYAAVFHRTMREPTDLGTAWVDIFRVENGLIVAHWAVGQPVSNKISAQHNMF